MSVVDRRIDDAVLERAADADVEIVARSVFLQGLILSTPAETPARLRPLVPYVDAVHALARETGTPPATLALGWVKQRPGVVGVVVGAHSEAELEELATAWSSPPLDDAVLAACASLPVPPDEWCDPRRWPS
jgi:aryl-alcohol dehydrogenase-like predicted oxidoreductase